MVARPAVAMRDLVPAHSLGRDAVFQWSSALHLKASVQASMSLIPRLRATSSTAISAF